MRLRLAFVCIVAALAAPAAEAVPPIPPLVLDEVLGLIPGTPEVRDTCVSEVEEDGTRRELACAPTGALPAPEWIIVLPRT